MLVVQGVLRGVVPPVFPPAEGRGRGRGSPLINPHTVGRGEEGAGGAMQGGPEGVPHPTLHSSAHLERLAAHRVGTQWSSLPAALPLQSVPLHESA